MKPRTKMEIYLSGLILKERKINLDKYFKPVSYRTKNYIHCLSCGKTFNTKSFAKKNKFTCPSCNKTSKVIETLKRTLNEEKYIDVVEVVENIQVIRTYMIIRKCKIGQEEIKESHEMIRWFITPKRNYLFAKATACVFYEWRWVLDSDIELRDPNYAIRYYGDTSSKYLNVPSAVIKIKLKDEFKYSFYDSKVGIPAVEYYSKYLQYPKLEFLVKTKQYALIEYMYLKKRFNVIENYQQEIITCIKNNYKISDYADYFDYIDLLRFFNKDTKNKKYCCPLDFKKEHNKYVQKKQLVISKYDNDRFISKMQNYFNINFGDDKLIIGVFHNLEELKHESNVLQLCTFKSEYYNRENSLLLSIKKNDEPIAMAEVNIKNNSINQLRGYDNETFPEYNEVKKLISKNVLSILKKKKKKLA